MKDKAAYTVATRDQVMGGSIGFISGIRTESTVRPLLSHRVNSNTSLQSF